MSVKSIDLAIRGLSSILQGSIILNHDEPVNEIVFFNLRGCKSVLTKTYPTLYERFHYKEVITL